MFRFNDIDFSSMIKVTDINRPIIAPQRISSSAIEGKSEEVFHRKASSSYNITVEFYYFVGVNETVIEGIRKLGGMLDTNEPAQLIFNDEPDKYVKAIVESAEFERKNRYAICNVTFKVLDPYFYAVRDDIFEYSSAGEKTFTTKGNSESYPIVEITGTGNSYGIEANGSSMTYNGSIPSGSKLVIDSALLTAYLVDGSGNKNSVLNQLDKLDFPVLKKGTNVFNITGSNLTNVKIISNSRWK